MQLQSAAELHRSAVESATRFRRLQKLGRTARAFKSLNCSLASREREERRRDVREGGREALSSRRSAADLKTASKVCCQCVLNPSLAHC